MLKKLRALEERAKSIYRSNYKKLIAIPFILFLLSTAVIFNHYLTTGEFISLDIELKGGTIATINWEESATPQIKQLEAAIQRSLDPSITVRSIYSYGKGKVIGFDFEAPATVKPEDLKSAIEAALTTEGFPTSLTGQNYSVKTVGPALGAAFLQTAITAIIIGFALMGVVIFLTFKTPAVVLTVVSCAFFDIYGAIAAMDLFGIKLSAATLAGLLMTIGYSVDSDILITTAVVQKSKGDPIDRAYVAMKTGMTMILTTFAAIFTLHLVSSSPLLADLTLVLLAGLFFDIINTWFQNLGVLLWYMEKKQHGTTSS